MGCCASKNKKDKVKESALLLSLKDSKNVNQAVDSNIEAGKPDKSSTSVYSGADASCSVASGDSLGLLSKLSSKLNANLHESIGSLDKGLSKNADLFSTDQDIEVIDEEDETTHDDLSWVKNIPPPAPPDTYPYYVTCAVEELHRKLYVDVFQLLMDEGLFFTSKKCRANSPFVFKNPSELRQEMDFSLRKKGTSHEYLVELIEGIIKYQPHVGHPFYMEQRTCGLEPYSCISDLVATCTNSNNALYIISTALTLLELELIRAVSQLVGYDPEGNGDGASTPGETLATGYAVRMAVMQKMPSIKRQGLSGLRRPIIYTSKYNVYSIRKSAVIQGFGTDSIVEIDTDQYGRMNMEDLKTKIEISFSRSEIPCMVIGSIGSGTLRAIDPLNRIADICEDYGLWFHVDGTWGGGLILSETLRHKAAGVERSDSFVWCQHFVLSVPCTSTCIVVPPRHKDKLSQYLGPGLGEGTGYALMKTPLYDPRFDMGHSTILSCRRPEMFKFWLMWKAKGTRALGRHIDYIIKNAQFCVDEMKKREGFHPILEQFEGSNVCFVYVPINYRGILQTSPLYIEKVSKITLALKQVLLMKGILSLSYNEIEGKPTFLILGLQNSAVARQDIVYVLDQIEYFGEALSNPSHERYQQYKSSHNINL